MKNKIVQWRGGGYDGCIWEPNTGFFDVQGQWHPVISTGCGRRDSLEEFQAKRSADDRVFPISKSGCLKMLDGLRCDFAMTTLQVLEENGYTAHWRCADCGKVIDGTEDFSGHYQDEHGDGGIGIVCEGPLCCQCDDDSRCNACGERAEKDSMTHGVCEWCIKAALEKDSKTAGKIQALREHIAKARKDCDAYCKLRPEWEKHAREHTQQLLVKLEDELDRLQVRLAESA